MRDISNATIAFPITQRRGRGATGFLAALELALRAIATRRQLAEMTPRLLSDIGVTRAEALREASRPPWDLGPPTRDPSRRRPWP
ncbi:DUF1127 domain-containing protein [Roseomonas sp. OT10]|uniref:DUF1127 domain-containing protein n=1 Tax=Roseomonas cutis TaxID=2897332 RepID=UPI001E2E545B|nr:DUF1127 domain-containing protein [Roseomonas sp. OT10]UFN48962.1 DUF1127 domain-containing protein [Roseomonas sp. OT10]